MLLPPPPAGEGGCGCGASPVLTACSAWARLQQRRGQQHSGVHIGACRGTMQNCRSSRCRAHAHNVAHSPPFAQEAPLRQLSQSAPACSPSLQLLLHREGLRSGPKKLPLAPDLHVHACMVSIATHHSFPLAWRPVSPTSRRRWGSVGVTSAQTATPRTQSLPITVTQGSEVPARPSSDAGPRAWLRCAAPR